MFASAISLTFQLELVDYIVGRNVILQHQTLQRIILIGLVHRKVPSRRTYSSKESRQATVPVHL